MFSDSTVASLSTTVDWPSGAAATVAKKQQKHKRTKAILLPLCIVQVVLLASHRRVAGRSVSPLRPVQPSGQVGAQQTAAEEVWLKTLLLQGKYETITQKHRRR